MNLQVVEYSSKYFDDCVRVFDSNCPKYFLPEERDPFVDYLKVTRWYFVVVTHEEVVGCFGLEFIKDRMHARLHWIMVHSDLQGKGVGSYMMEHVFQAMKGEHYRILEIDTSQEGIQFFKRYEVEILAIIENGWGEGMDRINLLLYTSY